MVVVMVVPFVFPIRVPCFSFQITGGGTITSASSDAWWARKVLGGFRPHLMSFDSVLRLTVDNIHTTNAPNHNIEISSSVAVRVRRCVSHPSRTSRTRTA